MRPYEALSIIAAMPEATGSDDADVLRVREAIVRVGRLMFDRGLTDAAGGNISARIDGSRETEAATVSWWCMSPRYAAHRWHWRLPIEEVLVLDEKGSRIRGEGEPSRDVNVHRAIYDAVPAAGAIVHAHAPMCLVFAAAGRSMEPVLAAARELGTVPIVDGVDEAREVAASLAGRNADVAAFAAATLVAGHGIIVAGRDLHHAYDALERLEANARCVLMAPLLASTSLNDAAAQPVWAP